MAEERIFVTGFRTFEKNAKAPEFILGSLVINLNEFFTWVKDHPEYQSDYKGTKQLKLTILNGKDGRVNFQVDTWKKAGDEVDDLGFTKTVAAKEYEKEPKVVSQKPKPKVVEEDTNSDLPF